MALFSIVRRRSGRVVHCDLDRDSIFAKESVRTDSNAGIDDDGDSGVGGCMVDLDESSHAKCYQGISNRIDVLLYTGVSGLVEGYQAEVATGVVAVGFGGDGLDVGDVERVGDDIALSIGVTGGVNEFLFESGFSINKLHKF